MHARHVAAARRSARLRARGYTGRLLWRSIQINFGFDLTAYGNAVKFGVNARLRNGPLATRLRALQVESLDIEAFTAARPETFFHDGTNHFYCICPRRVLGRVGTLPVSLRERCPSSYCDQELRGTYHDNGEPSRYLAQMTLHAICRTHGARYRDRQAN